MEKHQWFIKESCKSDEEEKEQNLASRFQAKK
jgi:hypothetical protein